MPEEVLRKGSFLVNGRRVKYKIARSTRGITYLYMKADGRKSWMLMHSVKLSVGGNELRKSGRQHLRDIQGGY